jgi:hypothetical protein
MLFDGVENIDNYRGLMVAVTPEKRVVYRNYSPKSLRNC